MTKGKKRWLTIGLAAFAAVVDTLAQTGVILVVFGELAFLLAELGQVPAEDVLPTKWCGL